MRHVLFIDTWLFILMSSNNVSSIKELKIKDNQDKNRRITQVHIYRGYRRFELSRPTQKKSIKLARYFLGSIILGYLKDEYEFLLKIIRCQFIELHGYD